jgi:hypothetical protein
VNVRAALLERVRPHRRTLATAMALGLLASVAGLAQPLARAPCSRRWATTSR